MSKSGVLKALEAGPMAPREILRFTGTPIIDVSRSCCELRHAGKIKRVDGGSGRGSRAIYALVESVEVPAAESTQPKPKQPKPWVDRFIWNGRNEFHAGNGVHGGSRERAGQAAMGRRAAMAAQAETLRVDRDPCTYCGVRADIGCKHQRVF